MDDVVQEVSRQRLDGECRSIAAPTFARPLIVGDGVGHEDAAGGAFHRLDQAVQALGAGIRSHRRQHAVVVKASIAATSFSAFHIAANALSDRRSRALRRRRRFAHAGSTFRPRQ